MGKNKDKARGVIRLGKFGTIITKSYCPVLGGACKYVVDGKCTAAVCKRRTK